MAELDNPTSGATAVAPTPAPGTPGASALTAREKRDLQKAQLRPLANRRPELYEEDEYSSDEYEAMMDMYNGTLASIEEGEIVKSKVLEIRDNLVVLDIGFKSEGTIPLEEFKDMPDLKPGDDVEVLLDTTYLTQPEQVDRIVALARAQERARQQTPEEAAESAAEWEAGGAA